MTVSMLWQAFIAEDQNTTDTFSTSNFLVSYHKDISDVQNMDLIPKWLFHYYSALCSLKLLPMKKTISRVNSLLCNRQCCHQIAVAKAAFQLGEYQTISRETWMVTQTRLPRELLQSFLTEIKKSAF